MNQTFTCLALGDSYTVGEGVPLQESFPYQTVQMLRKAGYHFHAPEIVAKTGYTSHELQEVITGLVLPETFDFVTLLAGVNNQYRSLSLSGYSESFESLIQYCLQRTGNLPKHVFVLSIPDWSVTPFAADRNRQQLAAELELFNVVCKTLALQYQVNYLDITGSTREAEMDMGLLASDGLHPSGREYRKWAERLSASMALLLQ